MLIFSLDTSLANHIFPGRKIGSGCSNPAVTQGMSPVLKRSVDSAHCASSRNSQPELSIEFSKIIPCEHEASKQGI